MVKAYFVDLAHQVITGNQTVKVSYPKIGSLALDAGATDYTNLVLNGRNESITVGAETLMVLGEVQVI